MASRTKARCERARFSKSLASRRQRPSHPNVRSTIQRLGSTTNPFVSQRLTISSGRRAALLTAAAVAALTVYDMCKSADRGMRVTELHLVHKAGGKSGTFEALG